MAKTYSGAAVPRHLVFATADGSFVVQWEPTRVQELLTGRYRSFSEARFGHTVSDYELTQLKAAGRVEHFNHAYVWLFALPEQSRFNGDLRTQERSRDRVRGYYINTFRPESDMPGVEQAMADIGLGDRLSLTVRSDMVAVVRANGSPFTQLRDAEMAQSQLVTALPHLCAESVIAFVDLPADDTEDMLGQTGELLDLDALIASQSDTTLTRGKHVIVAVRDADACMPVLRLLGDLGMNVHITSAARETLEALEDSPPGLLIMDLELSDMHGWQLLGRIREIMSLANLAIIVIADEGTAPDLQSFGVGVAKVDAFMTRPLSLSRLRHNIWHAFNSRASAGPPQDKPAE